MFAGVQVVIFNPEPVVVCSGYQCLKHKPYFEYRETEKILLPDENSMGYNIVLGGG